MYFIPAIHSCRMYSLAAQRLQPLHTLQHNHVIITGEQHVLVNVPAIKSEHLYTRTAALTASDKRLSTAVSSAVQPHGMHTARVSTWCHGSDDTSMPCEHAWARNLHRRDEPLTALSKCWRRGAHAEGCTGSRAARSGGCRAHCERAGHQGHATTTCRIAATLRITCRIAATLCEQTLSFEE